MVLIMLSEAGSLALLVVAFIDFLADITGRYTPPAGVPSLRPASRTPDAARAVFRKAA